MAIQLLPLWVAFFLVNDMTKLLYWLGAIAVFAFYGFSEHAVPATDPVIYAPAPIIEASPDVDQDVAYQEMYRYVSDDQMGMGNICIEAKHKECEVYR